MKAALRLGRGWPSHEAREQQASSSPSHNRDSTENGSHLGVSSDARETSYNPAPVLRPFFFLNEEFRPGYSTNRVPRGRWGRQKWGAASARRMGRGLRAIEEVKSRSTRPDKQMKHERMRGKKEEKLTDKIEKRQYAVGRPVSSASTQTAGDQA